MKKLIIAGAILAGCMAFGQDSQEPRWMNGTWCSIGTSITWYNNHSNGKFEHGYQDRVCEVLKFTSLFNVGISGAYLEQSLGSAVAADYYTIEHGLNDWGSTIPVGTMDDYRNGTKNGTFFASYRQMIDEIRSLNPAAKIVLCTPRRGIGAGWFPSSSDDPCTNKGTPGTYLKDYVEAIKAIAVEENLPVADFYSTCGTDAELPSLSIDNAVHPNDAGYQLMADELIKAFASVEANPDPVGLKWRKTPGLLTEIVTEGTPWVLNLTDAGVLSIKTYGDSLVLDLSETATGDGVEIKQISGLANAANITEVIMPDSVTTVGHYCFNGCKALKKVRLSPNISSLGDRTFYNCGNLEEVENCLPPTLTTLGHHLFGYCRKLSTPIEIGFGLDPTQGDSEFVIPGEYGMRSGLTFAFFCCEKVPSVRIGPGVITVWQGLFGGMSGLGYLEFGENVLTNWASTADCSSLTNIAINATNTICLCDKFAGGKLREISWKGWFTVKDGATAFSWNARQVQFFVPGNNLGWAGFMADPSRMTPWSSLDAATQAAYYERYGEEADEPAGLSVGATGFPETWIVSDGTVLPGYALTVGELNSAFGSISVTPPPPGDWIV